MKYIKLEVPYGAVLSKSCTFRTVSFQDLQKHKCGSFLIGLEYCSTRPVRIQTSLANNIFNPSRCVNPTPGSYIEYPCQEEIQSVLKHICIDFLLITPLVALALTSSGWFSLVTDPTPHSDFWSDLFTFNDKSSV